jgi:hypothetical protein
VHDEERREGIVKAAARWDVNIRRDGGFVSGVDAV